MARVSALARETHQFWYRKGHGDVQQGRSARTNGPTSDTERFRIAQRAYRLGRKDARMQVPPAPAGHHFTARMLKKRENFARDGG